MFIIKSFNGFNNIRNKKRGVTYINSNFNINKKTYLIKVIYFLLTNNLLFNVLSLKLFKNLI